MTVILLVLAGLLCLPFLSEFLQLALRPVHRVEPGGLDADSENPRLLFLIPAHDEELLVESCIRSVQALEYPAEHFDIILIADNCRDGTASITESLGATVFERDEPENPGKPAALAWAIQRIDIGNYDACVILDADSVVDSGFALALSESRPLRHKAVQTYFGLRNEWDTWLTRLAGVLARVRYEVTYPRKHRANINCPLTGNGMVIGSGLLAETGWRAFSLTENWELYAMLTVEGTAIGLNCEARLFSEEAGTTDQSRTQRTRWMAGRSSVFRDYWRQIVSSNGIGTRQKLDALCELGRLSPVLHLGAALGVVAFALLFVGSPTRWVISGISFLSVMPEVEGVLRVLSRHPKRATILLDLLRLPYYFAWRIAVTIATVFGARPTTWKRTERRRA